MTVTELKRRVLEKLQVIAAGEEPNINDATTVGGKYVSLHDMLVTEGLVDWSNTESVPDWAEHPITLMVAAMSASDFGVPSPRWDLLQREGAFNLHPSQGGPSIAERQLRNQVARQFIYYPQPTEYY